MNTVREMKTVYSLYVKRLKIYKNFQEFRAHVERKQAQRRALQEELRSIERMHEMNACMRFAYAKSELAYRLAARFRIPTSSKNARYYSKYHGSEMTRNYSSRWGAWMTSHTYVYIDDARRLCYETGRGRKGSTYFVFPRDQRYTDLVWDYEALLPGTQFCINLRDPARPGLHKLLNVHGELRTYAHWDGHTWEHGRSMHQIRRERLRKSLIKERHDRIKKTMQIAERAVRMCSNLPVVITYADGRGLGFCRDGIAAWKAHVGIPAEQNSISYADLRQLIDTDRARVLKILIHKVYEYIEARKQGVAS